MKAINYNTIRGRKQVERCIHGTGRCYCDCGCMQPHADDPSINLDGVTVGPRIELNPGSCQLLRDGQMVGSISPQHTNYISIDGYEYLGCDPEPLAHLINAARQTPRAELTTAGSTLTETAADAAAAEAADLADQDARHAGQPGYCTKCHTYCYGDCEA